MTQDSTTTGLTTNSASQAYGSEQSTIFTVTVATGNGEPLPAAETVTVDVGSTNCVATVAPTSTGGSGGCSIGATDLDVGGYTATATYAGDTDLSGSGPATTPFAVTQDSTTTGLTTNSASQAYGSEQSTTFTVTVRTGNGESLPPGERVTVSVGTTSCVATLTPTGTGGRGGCPIGATALAVGPYTATATYGGDTDLSGSGPATTTFTVTQDSTTTGLTTNSASQVYGSEQSTIFTVTVATGNGEPLPAAETVTVDVGSTDRVATVAPTGTGGSGGCSMGPRRCRSIPTRPRQVTAGTPICPARARRPRPSPSHPPEPSTWT